MYIRCSLCVLEYIKVDGVSSIKSLISPLSRVTLGTRNTKRIAMSDTTPRAEHLLTAGERRERYREEMREAILQAARGVMRTEGVTALTLHGVAERLGMRAPSLYSYFPSKTALYEALFLLGAQQYLEQLEGVFRTHTTFWEALEAGIENYMSFAQENPDLYQLVFQRVVPDYIPSDACLEALGRIIARSNTGFRETFATAQLDTDLPSDQVLDLYLGMMYGLTALHLANEPDQQVGSGRFGSLSPVAIELFRRALTWRR